VLVTEERLEFLSFSPATLAGMEHAALQRMLSRKQVFQAKPRREVVEADLFACEVQLAQASWKLSRINTVIQKASAELERAKNPLGVVVVLEKAKKERAHAESDLARARARCLRALMRCWKTVGLTGKASTLPSPQPLSRRERGEFHPLP